MSRWWRVAIANWWANPSRTLAVVLSVALGVGVVVTITSFYATARRAITEQVVQQWLGSAHVTIHAPGAHWGSMDADLAPSLRALDNVHYVTSRLRRRMRIHRNDPTGQVAPETNWKVDAVGIDPDTEQHFHTITCSSGRLFRSGEHQVVVLEQAIAEGLNIKLQDTLYLTRGGSDKIMAFTVVGIYAMRRLAEFQQATIYIPLPDLQELTGERGVVSAIDLMLEDSSPEALHRAELEVNRTIKGRNYPYPYRVETALARQQLLTQAEGITRMLLMLAALIAMLAAFFIILTTQSVGLQQRRPMLGIMRCVGMTRTQLAGNVLADLAPPGLIGTLLGVIGGLLVTYAVGHFAADYLTHMVISGWGMVLAVVCGLCTTLLSAIFLTAQVIRVSPLEAVAIHAGSVRLGWVYGSGLVGALLLITHIWMVAVPKPTNWLTPLFAFLGTGTIYLGYALITPPVVVLLGRPLAKWVGRLFGLRASLADEPFARSPWRSTGACWVLMVGLSLIIHLSIRSRLVRSMWDFPAQLPETFVWSPTPVPGSIIERVRALPGVGDSTVTTDIACDIEVEGRPAKSLKESLLDRFLRRLTRPVFVAGEPEKLLNMMKVVFIEGNQREAIEKVRRGGYVVIPIQTARNKHIGVGDKVKITIRRKTVTFEVAGVVQSPAMDLAVTAFQAESYMEFAAASAVLGSRDDLKKRFGLDLVSMFMCNLDLPPVDPPPDFDRGKLPELQGDRAAASALLRWVDHLPLQRESIERVRPMLTAWLADAPTATLPPDARRELGRFVTALRIVRTSYRNHQSPDQIWDILRERLVLLAIVQGINRPEAIVGSLRRLKQEVDQSLDRATVLITWLPSLMLAVAALGIGNLMQVSVSIRARSIAMLRAVGAMRSQIIRMVLTEAVTLGLLGCVIGVALGIHLSYSVFVVAERLLDMVLPLSLPLVTTAMAVALTVTMCILAGIAPARLAARNNIISALQTT